MSASSVSINFTQSTRRGLSEAKRNPRRENFTERRHFSHGNTRADCSRTRVEPVPIEKAPGSVLRSLQLRQHRPLNLQSIAGLPGARAEGFLADLFDRVARLSSPEPSILAENQRLGCPLLGRGKKGNRSYF